MDGLGIALESTRLAERELASNRLVRPLQGICKDVTYTGHWLVFPRAKRYSQSLTLFSTWIAKELGLAFESPQSALVSAQTTLARRDPSPRYAKNGGGERSRVPLRKSKPTR